MAPDTARQSRESYNVERPAFFLVTGVQRDL